jgi:hypothetical protein
MSAPDGLVSERGDDGAAVVQPDPGVAALQREVGSLVREMGRAHGEMLRFRVEHYKETYESADNTLRRTDEERLDSALRTVPSHLSWFDLSTISEHSPELALGAWQRVKDEAADELASGHRAATALEAHSGPWDRAQFLAIREGFVEEWQPRGLVELALIDQMATAHAQYLFWLERLNQEGVTRALRPANAERRKPMYEPPRITSAQAVEEAAAMADRFQRLFVRAVRTLRDLRRYAPTVVVQNAGQVNVGAVQTNQLTRCPDDGTGVQIEDERR